MIRTIRKVGGSLALIIPRDIAELLKLKEGTEVNLDIDANGLVINRKKAAS